MTWLIVEDEEDIRNIVSIMCQSWGHQTLAFPDGNQAFAWLDTVETGSYQGELPELAILDIRMPGPTGDRIAQRIRQTNALKHMAIVMMTAFSLSQDDIDRMTTVYGADEVIHKPLPDMDDLNAMLHSVLAAKKANHA